MICKTMICREKGEYYFSVINLRYYEKYNGGSVEKWMEVSKSLLDKGKGKISSPVVELQG